MPNCSEATCQGNGVITVSPRRCPRVQKPTCANGYPAVQVADRDGCCSHYQCQCECVGRGRVVRGEKGRTELGWTQGGHPKSKAPVVVLSLHWGAARSPAWAWSPRAAGARRRRESGPPPAPAGQSSVWCRCRGPDGKAVTAPLGVGPRVPGAGAAVRPVRRSLLRAGVCSGWGDPHYITFDGTYYTFLDNCTYVLVQQIVPVYGHFRVLVENYFCNSEDGLSCPQSIIVEYQENRVMLVRRPVHGVMTNEVGARQGGPQAPGGLRAPGAGCSPPPPCPLGLFLTGHCLDHL